MEPGLAFFLSPHGLNCIKRAEIIPGDIQMRFKQFVSFFNI